MEDTALALQRSLGSLRLQRFSIGQPRDHFEWEAERVAERMMGMPLVVTIVKPMNIPGQQTTGNASGVAPALVNQALQSRWQPLDTKQKNYFEAYFGANFDSVRLHAGTTAAESAEGLQARAYTLGEHIVFGAGEYSTQTRAGQVLLAHELTHVIQQRGRSGENIVQCQLREPPTKMVTSEPEEITFPKDDEIKLDKRIKNRQQQNSPDGKGKYIGTVTYKNLPAEITKQESTKEANLERRACKHALLEVITSNIIEKGGKELRVRVPLDDSPATSKAYAMVVLRFDKQRNAEAEYAGKDVQKIGSVANESVILSSLGTRYGVTFLTDSITAQVPGTASAKKYTGKQWNANDSVLVKDAFSLLGNVEAAILKGCKIRRLAVKTAGNVPGFYFPGDNSINLADDALPFEKGLWFGEGGRFFTRGVHTALHEIGHALHYAKAAGGNLKSPKELLDLFKEAVLRESRRRTNKNPGSTFPPPAIIPPTEYATTNWMEFYADTYSIYRTNPTFLRTVQFQYLYDFFQHQFP